VQERRAAEETMRTDAALQAAVDKGEHVLDDGGSGFFDDDGRLREQELYDSVFAAAGSSMTPTP